MSIEQDLFEFWLFWHWFRKDSHEDRRSESSGTIGTTPLTGTSHSNSETSLADLPHAKASLAYEPEHDMEMNLKVPSEGWVRATFIRNEL
jgi:hypothetical protein